MADVQGGGGQRRDVPESKSAEIDHAASGNNTLISAVTGKRIAVSGLWLIAENTVAVEFRDGTTTPFTGAAPFRARQGIVLGPGGEQSYWFIGSTNTAFVANLSAAIGIRGSIQYREID